jgi:transposase-like protein
VSTEGMGSSKGDRRTRRQFSDEFKTGPIRLVLDEGRTVGAVLREARSDTVRTERGQARAGRPNEGQEGKGKERRQKASTSVTKLSTESDQAHGAGSQSKPSMTLTSDEVVGKPLSMKSPMHLA